MRQRLKSTLPALALALFAAFGIWMTGHAMPEVVASHFDVAGSATAYMPRDSYIALMAGMALILPVGTAVLPALLLGVPHVPINGPNRTYWLAPERRDATIDQLIHYQAAFAVLPSVLLAYVHLLVLFANLRHPPEMAMPLLWGGVAALLIACILWSRMVFRRFSRVPD
jgi:uncharacterized membrane protein